MGQETWKNDDSIIMCAPWFEGSPGVRAYCELCYMPISAWPSSIKQSGKPGWHLLCVFCTMMKGQTDDLTFSGTINKEGVKPWESR